MNFYWFLHMCAFTIDFTAHISYQTSPKNNYISLNVLEKSLNLKMKFLYEPWVVIKLWLIIVLRKAKSFSTCISYYNFMP